MSEDSGRLRTDMSGFDEILRGGLLPNRAYLVRGSTGTGKTTMGIHFLLEGVSNGENVLFVTLGETADQIRKDAGRLGDEVEDINFLDLSPTEKFFEESQDYDIFSPADVERDPTAKKIKATVKSLRPSRVFVDSITPFRYLTSDEYQFHEQVLSFIQFLTHNDCTVLFASEVTEQAPDDDLQFLADGVFNLSLDER